MSELIQKHDNRATIRWKLLTGASALALTAYISSANAAMADGADRPLVWIELGGQLSRLQDSQEIYTPPFLALTPSIFSPPQKAERPPLYGIDEGAAISFQPEDSNWIFSASIRYGRSASAKHVHHQTYPGTYPKYIRYCYFSACAHQTFPVTPIGERFTDARVKQSENHMILDFQAGKDLGLGLFGPDATSTLGFGVRIAQFRSKSRVSLGLDPDWQLHVHSSYLNYYSIIKATLHTATQSYRSFAGSFRADRSFHGIGPSLSWKSSVPFAGNAQDGELNVDWGLNASLLFGRQKSQTSHQTSGWEGTNGNTAAPNRAVLYRHGPYSHTRSRNVTVPNVGGFAGLSWSLQNFKMSFGYKADFFFNAIDGGIDTAKKENRGFNGPYASISIGLGD